MMMEACADDIGRVPPDRARTPSRSHSATLRDACTPVWNQSRLSGSVTSISHGSFGRQPSEDRTFAPLQQRVGRRGLQRDMPVAVAVDPVVHDVLGQHLDHADFASPCAHGVHRVEIAVLEQRQRGEDLRPENIAAGGQSWASVTSASSVL